MTRQPNILLITTDQMRGDCLGFRHHPDVKTPFLDTMFLNGVSFDNAYTACPSCIAARAGLMTGLAPEHHGRVGYQDGVPWNYEHTLAGELAKAGYYTQCVGKMHTHPLRNHLGFHDVELHDGYLHYYRNSNTPHHEHQAVADDYLYWLKDQLGASKDITDTGLECNSWIARPWIYPEEYHPTNWVATRSIDFLRRRDRSQPFFLMAGFVRPHPPFDAPQCYFDFYRHKTLRQPPVGDWADPERYLTQGRRIDGPEGIADPELLNEAMIGYYSCITHIDHQIGRIIQALQTDNCYNDTVIIFTADHGELLGDHHMFRKIRPYQGSVHVPFVMQAPKDIISKTGVSYEQVVELRDIMPTLIDIAHGSIPPELDGKSLLSVLKDPQENLREYIHGEHSGGEIGNQFIVTPTDKYIWFTQSGTEQYFELSKDPQELCDKSKDPACQSRIDHLRNCLIKELTGREEGYTDGEKLIAGQQERSVLSFLQA